MYCTTRTLRRSAPPDIVDSVHDLLDSVWSSVPDLRSRDRMSLETAIIELTATVIQHANRGKGIHATFSVIAYQGRVEATVSDSGEADYVELENRSMPEADGLSESGRGLPLMQALVDTVEHRHVDGFNQWTLVRGGESADAERALRRGMPSVSMSGVIDKMARQRTLVLPNLLADARFAHQSVPGAYAFCAGHPLYAPGAEQVGSFCSLEKIGGLALLASSSQEVVDALHTRARGTAADDVTVAAVRRDA